MQYLGGKRRPGKAIAAFLSSRRKPGQQYVEPFLGAAGVFTHMSGPRWGQDANVSMMMLLQEVRDGVFMYPEMVSEAEYAAARTLPDCAMKAFIGIGCSFGGKWWGGYARRKGSDATTFVGAAARRLQSIKLTDALLTHGDYTTVTTTDALIYCDPPYASTTGYGATGKFDSGKFWAWCRTMSVYNDVYVSEYAAPADFTRVWEKATFDEAKQQWVNGTDVIMLGRVKATNAMAVRSVNGWAILVNPDEVTPLCLITETELLEKLQCNG